MGSKVQSAVGCFPELCFLQFSVAQVTVRYRKQFTNIFAFPLGPVLSVLLIIKIIMIIIMIRPSWCFEHLIPGFAHR